MYISNNQLPNENLSQDEIKEKISYLERQIRNSAWGINTENRQARVNLLKSYLD